MIVHVTWHAHSRCGHASVCALAGMWRRSTRTPFAQLPRCPYSWHTILHPSTEAQQLYGRARGHARIHTGTLHWRWLSLLSVSGSLSLHCTWPRARKAGARAADSPRLRPPSGFKPGVDASPICTCGCRTRPPLTVRSRVWAVLRRAVGVLLAR